MQSKATARLHDIWQAETRASAEQAFESFVEDFQAKYDFTAEHWKHLRTTNSIESTFAKVAA